MKVNEVEILQDKLGRVSLSSIEQAFAKQNSAQLFLSEFLMSSRCKQLVRHIETRFDGKAIERVSVGKRGFKTFVHVDLAVHHAEWLKNIEFETFIKEALAGLYNPDEIAEQRNACSNRTGRKTKRSLGFTEVKTNLLLVALDHLGSTDWNTVRKFWAGNRLQIRPFSEAIKPLIDDGLIIIEREGSEPELSIILLTSKGRQRAKECAKLPEYALPVTKPVEETKVFMASKQILNLEKKIRKEAFEKRKQIPSSERWCKGILIHNLKKERAKSV